ncbi:putative ubiquitin-specific processing protease 21 [Paraphysoderma sedebokerense]|nr:putative ubiquitin-specific processing protease 21 [Paraphysoderma sedebokerense]
MFRWHISSWNELKKNQKVYSEYFECGGNKWRILIFPNGNNNPNLAVYLDVMRKEDDPDWNVCADFVLGVVNPTQDTYHHVMYSSHRFDGQESDWGFTNFVHLRNLDQIHPERNKAFIESDQTIITAYVRVVKDETGILWHNFHNYDSKKVTGFVGLKNQGATCYMNSLLQSLYCTNYFRKAVYQIPTVDDEPTKSVSLALQRVFYQLQTNDQAVGTQELTKSFGWDTLDAFMQHDVQEFNRVLQDNLETKMKKTPADGAIQKLFVGKMKSYIKCINVDYESSRIENYYDIQLNVKKCANLRDSFVDYCTVETLDGENKYMAEGHGLQDAKKGVIFENFPPVLHLQLKRFEYDMHRDAMVKINDRHEFPTDIDLTEFLSEEAKASNPPPQKYRLHGVLVHSGDLSGGHYCAFIKPKIDGKWLKFDDDRVTPATAKEVFDDNFGGEFLPRDANGEIIKPVKPVSKFHKRFTNAYMLVYIREHDLENILGEVTEEDIPQHIPQRLNEEKTRAEARMREERERHLYLEVKLVDDECMKNHEGLDLVNFDFKEFGLSPLLYQNKVEKAKMTWGGFKELFSQETGIDLSQVRFWVFTPRQNKTLRPDTILGPEADNMTIEKLKEKCSISSHKTELRVYVERLKEAYSHFNPYALIFVKYFNVVTGEMSVVGHYHVQRSTPVKDFVNVIYKMTDLPPNVPIKLFEEIRSNMIDPIKLKSTWAEAEIGNGDIVVFQQELSPKDLEALPKNQIKSVPEHFEFINTRVAVHFKPKDPNALKEQLPKAANESAQTSVEHTLILSKKLNYDAVAAKLAEKIHVDPSKIRFSQSSSSTALTTFGSDRGIVRRGSNTTLNEMLGVHSNVGLNASAGGQMGHTLFYEVMGHAVADLESKKLVKIVWVNQNMKEDGTHEFLLPKTLKAQALYEHLIPKVKFSENGSNKIRIWETIKSSFLREISPDDDVNSIQDYNIVYAEEIPMEEVHMLPEDKFIYCTHFHKQFTSAHGIPFKFVLKHGELFAETKKRLQSRLNLSDKEFAKIRICLYHITKFKPETQYKYLEDDDAILADETINVAETFLGLDHPDKSRSKFGGFEKAIKIFN